jgi:uncharacterized phage protein (TIGR01671 family)
MLQADDDYGTKHSLDCVVYFMQGQPVELMQYTGIKDAFDKEVYEGDIVRYGTEDAVVTALVDFAEEDSEESMFLTGFKLVVINSADYADGDDSDHALEVIGNIYENSELLKETT